VIKVNVRENFEDIDTILFAPTAEFAANPDKKFTAFAKLDKPQRFENPASDPTWPLLQVSPKARSGWRSSYQVVQHAILGSVGE